MARTKYEPDNRGIRELANESGIQAASLAAGRAVQSWAENDDPGGEYATRGATVTAGWNNESRAGAIVEETKRDKGAANRTLFRAAGEARS